MKTILRQLAPYRQFIRWILQDALLREKGRAAFVLLIGFMGVGLQVAVFGLVILYARNFTSGESVNLVGYVFDVRTSLPLLGGVTIAMSLMLSMVAFFLYFFRRTIISMSREYEEFCAKRIFHKLDSEMLFQIKPSELDNSYLFQLVRTDSKYAGWVLRLLLMLLIPGAMFSFSVAVLYYLDPLLSCIITFVGGGFFYYQYRVSRRASQHSLRYEKLNPIAARAYRSLISDYMQQIRFENDYNRVERVFSDGAVKDQLNAYEGRLGVVEESRLVTGIFTALIVGLTILVLGSEIIKQGEGWGRLLVYVVALRFAMTNLQASFSNITSINRFYHQVRRYFAFVTALADKDESASQVPDMYRLEADNAIPHLKASKGSLNVSRGSKVALISPLKLNRYTLPALCVVLLGEQSSSMNAVLRSARYATGEHSSPNGSLRNVLNLNEVVGVGELGELFPSESHLERFLNCFPKGLDEPISPELWGDLASDTKFITALLSACRRGASWVFLQERELRRLPAEDAQFYLDLLSDSITVLVYDSDLSAVGSYDEQVVVVSDGVGIKGMGDTKWFNSVRGDAETLIGKEKVQDGKVCKVVPEEDDLLE